MGNVVRARPDIQPHMGEKRNNLKGQDSASGNRNVVRTSVTRQPTGTDGFYTGGRRSGISIKGEHKS